MDSTKEKTQPLAGFADALSYHQQGNIDKAERAYQKYLKKHPKDVHALQLFAILKGQMGEYKTCQYWLEKALKIAPNSAQLHNNLANALKHQDKIDQAIDHYRQAITLEPDNAAAHHNLAVLYQQQEQPGKALKHYQKATNIKPDYVKARYHLALLLIRQNNPTQALSELNMVIEKDPSHAQAYYHLGQLYHEQGDLDKAVYHYKQCLHADPDAPLAHHNLAAALVNQGDFEAAIKHFEKTIELDPNHDTVQENLAATYLAQNDATKALRHYLTQLEIKPTLESYYNIGVIYMHQDRHQDAITYLREALHIDPKHLNSHINLGAVYLKMSDYPNADLHYQAALALDAKNPELNYILSAINEKDTDFDQAPDAYITNLFDQYAPHFDKHLTEYLKYDVPKQLYQTLLEYLGDTSGLAWDICDLGCGSGLCAEPFKSMAKKFTGIDLSEKMLEVARKKNLYDELIHSSITNPLSLNDNYDLVISADTLPYIGNLAPAFENAANLLKRNGMFLFTIEKSNNYPHILQRTARFAHHRDYIEQQATKHHFTTETCKNITIRQDRGKPVEGYLYLLQLTSQQ